MYELAHYCNRNEEIIPRRVIERPPSAELAPGQRDQDTLPAYTTLDAIVEAFVERHDSVDDMVRSGIADVETVKRVVQKIMNNEYKRRQAPPGPKITPCSFGRERRYPITTSFSP